MISLQNLYEVTKNLSNDLSFFCHFAYIEPIRFEEVVQEKMQRFAMNEDIKSIKKNDIWKLLTLPKGKQFIGVKCIFKVKKNAEGKVERFKARLVVKGYRQRSSIDYR